MCTRVCYTFWIHVCCMCPYLINCTHTCQPVVAHTTTTCRTCVYSSICAASLRGNWTATLFVARSKHTITVTTRFACNVCWVCVCVFVCVSLCVCVCWLWVRLKYVCVCICKHYTRPQINCMQNTPRVSRQLTAAAAVTKQNKCTRVRRVTVRVCVCAHTFRRFVLTGSVNCAANAHTQQ